MSNKYVQIDPKSLKDTVDFWWANSPQNEEQNTMLVDHISSILRVLVDVGLTFNTKNGKWNDRRD